MKNNVLNIGIGLFFALNCFCLGEVAAQNREAQMAERCYLRYYQEARQVQDAAKGQAIENFRQFYAKHTYLNLNNYSKDYRPYLETLQADGTFADLHDKDAGKVVGGNSANSGGSITEGYYRLWAISEAFRRGELDWQKDGELWRRCQKAIVHYGELEISRGNEWYRFHASCFALPEAAVNIYFCHLPQMDAVEKGKTDDFLLKKACDMLNMIALQAWTQPYRKDETDLNVVSEERFRKHVWWVGGNGVGYRALLQAAFMYRSIPMIDVLAEVCRKGITPTSQTTYDDSFWNEGFTADGAGWGHGRQCLVWGYPIDGTRGALGILTLLKGTPWAQQLDRRNVEALMNYFRGANFYYYKGYKLACVDRSSMLYMDAPAAIPYSSLLDNVLANWIESFTPDEQEELKRLRSEIPSMNINMNGDGRYNGTRWFFNNDDLVKKNDRYHVIANMASVRCDGLESAYTFADAFNYYTNDGALMFQRRGNEYRNVYGAYDVTAFPGVTAREGMEQLKPVENWRGYCSKYNFAGAATSGGENAAAGFVFEKMNASDKKGVNDKGRGGADRVIYGVKAHKAAFILGDYVVALGAGITNLTPEVNGNIRTTLDQTERTGNVFVHHGKGIDWIVQRGGFAYSAFPEYQKRMHYVCETKRTDWVKMNPANRGRKNLPAEVDMLRLWIDHGTTPTDDTYGYAVYCGDGLPADRYPFRVLRNDTTLQAVRSTDGRVTGAVFYRADEGLKAKHLQLSVSAPCVVLIEQTSEGTLLSVTDACMDKNLKEIRVNWNGKTYICPMSQGELCGKPTVVKL